jgi:hypothetical protein
VKVKLNCYRSLAAVFITGALISVNAIADDIIELEPNDTATEAQNVDGDFTVGPNDDIADADTMPWVSISAGGDETFDYFSFEVPAAGVEGVFDIDYGYVNSGGVDDVDTVLCLYDAVDWTVLADSDDSDALLGAGGSIGYLVDDLPTLDSYIAVTFPGPGTYVIGVGERQIGTASLCDSNGIVGLGLHSGAEYELQISLSEHHVITPQPPGPVLVDSDGDGIPDDEDACVNSDLSSTVVVQDCDSGVDNTLFDDGCTIADLVMPCAEDPTNHGAFGSCVGDVINDLKKAGAIAGSEKGQIQRCAAQSDLAE